MTKDHKESLATADKIIKGLGSQGTINPKYQAVLRRQKLRKEVQRMDYELGIQYRDWLDSIREHPQYEEACQRVDAIFKELDTLTEAGEYEEAINFIKKKNVAFKHLVKGK